MVKCIWWISWDRLRLLFVESFIKSYYLQFKLSRKWMRLVFSSLHFISPNMLFFYRHIFNDINANCMAFEINKSVVHIWWAPIWWGSIKPSSDSNIDSDYHNVFFFLESSIMWKSHKIWYNRWTFVFSHLICGFELSNHIRHHWEWNICHAVCTEQNTERKTERER